jgi:alpha-L-fucosidase
MERKFSYILISKVLAVCALGMTLNQSVSAQWAHKEGDPMPHSEGYLVQPFTKVEWDASNYAPEHDIQWFRDAKVGFLAQFGLSTHNYAEVSWGLCYTRKAPDYGHGPIPDDIWPAYAKELKFEKFNAREWVELMQRAGFKYFVAQAKHHEGFHWWDTRQSDFKVTNTPFGRDLLKELADACHAAGMPFGIYYCQREWYHPDYCPVDTSKVVFTGSLWWKLKPGEISPMGPTHQKYLEYNKKAVCELLTQYGKVDIFWWDAAWWGGMFTAEMWDAENLTRMVRKLQPHILENNRASLPGDFDTPEQRLGNFQDWRPWETCLPLGEEWANPRSPLKPFSQLIGSIVHNVCCDGNIMFGFGPQWDGSFTEAQKTRLFEVGNWLKQNDSSIYATRGGPWKFSDWGGSTYRGTKVYLHIIQWNGETLRLPEITERKVISSRLLSGEAVSVKQTGKVIEIIVPQARQDSIDTVVELTMDKSVDGLKAIESGGVSFFNATTYGHVISAKATVTPSSRGSKDQGTPNLLVAENPICDYAFRTAEELNPWVQIDLGREFNVTYVRVMNPAGFSHAKTFHLSVSIDGKAWKEVWKTNSVKELLEIPINGFLAGALVPGMKTRYIRLELHSSKPESLQLKQVEVWGK